MTTTSDPRFETLVLERLEFKSEKTGQKYYQDGLYRGVIKTSWNCDDKYTDYYYLHLPLEQWTKIFNILDENEYKFTVLSDLPDGTESKNFLEELSRMFFGLEFQYF